MMTLKLRRGVTLIEVIVVIAILAILIGLVLAAVHRVRMAAVHTQSINNERQMILAFHQLLDIESSRVSGLPSTQQNMPTFSRNQTIFRLLLPWTYGPRIVPENYNSMSIFEKHDFIFPKVKTYRSPGDPSFDFSDNFSINASKCSYACNMMVFESSVTFPFKIPDGTSQTICFGEHYFYCKSNEETLSYDKVFQLRESQIIGSGERRATFGDAGSYDVMPVTVNGVSTASVPGKTFQYRPKVEDAWSRVMQTPHAAGLPVAMFDGSVRTLSPSISESTYWGLITPSGGEVLGEY